MAKLPNHSWILSGLFELCLVPEKGHFNSKSFKQILRKIVHFIFNSNTKKKYLYTYIHIYNIYIYIYIHQEILTVSINNFPEQSLKFRVKWVLSKNFTSSHYCPSLNFDKYLRVGTSG